MGIAQSKKAVLELNVTKTAHLNSREESLAETGRNTKMPSIEQCEVASGSVAALPSTMDFFDKFKCISSISDNGKDSDSEESFHLPLDDDDMENQSVVSNGRDREIHNEETEDDILNKFETVPSGTPDHIDSHIEDSILDDDHFTDKESDSKDISYLNKATTLPKKNTDENDEASDTVKIVEENKTHIEEPVSETSEKCTLEEANRNKVEIKLTYDFGEYEDSGDGEFKSVYETDELASNPPVEEPQAEASNPPVEEPQAEASNPPVEEPQAESTKPVETVEPMEIAEEPEIVECTSDEMQVPQPIQNSLPKVEETLDNFEDSMEVEQEDTTQDIANIIEKLEDQDTPMQDVEPLTDEGDVNMVECCEDTLLTDSSKLTNSDKEIAEKEAEVVAENCEDVEMIGDEISDEPLENCKENVDQVGINESAEAAPTFQEPLEVAEGTTEACSGEAQEQNNISIKEKCSDNEIRVLENEEQVGEPADTKENEKTLDDQTVPTEDKTSEKLIENEDPVESTDLESTGPVDSDDLIEIKDLVDIDNIVESKNDVDKQNEEESSEQKDVSESAIEQDTDENITTALCGSSEPIEDVEQDDSLKSEINRDKPKRNQLDHLENDDLLKELDKTINETDNEVEKAPETDKPITNAEVETPKKPETDEKGPCKDEDVFKAPVEVPKSGEAIPAQKEENEGPDLQSDKSNDKTDEDESDLLDISMVRETEEDDACAIADALDDKDAQSSEKSDEEHSEKVETEQEGSDIDKDNDNDPIEFDDTDDDSHAEGADLDDSSSAESTKGKIINISESSKDSESEPKRRKKSVDSYTDASNDCATAEVSASESGEEPEKMDVPDSLVPDTSLSLETTLVQDDAVPSVAEEDRMTAPVPSEEAKDDQGASKTDKSTEKVDELPTVEAEPLVDSLPTSSKSTEIGSERKKTLLNKRTFSTSDTEDSEVAAKKPKLASTVPPEAAVPKEPAEKTPVSDTKTDSAKDTATVNEKVKTLTGFSKFMQCRQFTAKLSRSDLEQFCIQKICESLMLKSSEGELHQTIKKQEKTIDYLRKDMQQLTKQSKDLEIVNKKLMNELRNQNALKKPLVPLKITRSVGLQVRLNPGNETPNQNRRRQMNTGSTPQKQVVNSTNATVNRTKVTTGTAQQPTVVRQVLQNSPQKSPLTTGQTTTNNATPTTTALLSQALQQQKPRQAQAVAAKRTTVVRKPAEAPKPGNPGVIDLTDEDDRLAATRTVAGSTIKILNKTVSPAGTQNKSLLNKIVPGKNTTNQGKQVGVQKTVTVGQNKGTTLSQGIRLTPASVITSNANGSPQMVYVVPTITSNAGGTQKVAFVNFQPTNGMLSGTLNGSTVSVMSNKGQTLTLKTVPSPMRNKHPAPLPAPPRVNPDPKLKSLLPKPHLTIKKIDTGIILQWKMPYNLEQYESIASYQLYAYQETSSAPSTDMWRKVGDVKALALPMACTLTQFADKNKYYFAVRSVDVHKRIGAFSDPEEISL